MPEVTKQFEIRQLLKAYRKGLLSDELFEEQMRELGAGGDAGPEARYRLRDQRFATERELVLRFLDEFRAGECFGGEAFALWAAASTDPAIRGGIQVVCDREETHGRRLAARLAALGEGPRVELPSGFREASRARLASREISDLEKIRDLTRRLPDIDEAVRPIREVIAQIAEDLETRTLLELILEDEISTLRWFHAAEQRLAAAAPALPSGEGDASRAPGGREAAPMANGANGAARPH